jgi:fibro-slime domain-containing protein
MSDTTPVLRGASMFRSAICATFICVVLSACSKSAPAPLSSGSSDSGVAREFGNAEAGVSAALDAGVSRAGVDAGIPDASGFTATEIGGYKLGDPVQSGALDAGIENQNVAAGCAVMVGVVRDFTGSDMDGGHPDFEAFDGKKPTTGLVANELGSGRKPVYASPCEAMPDRMLCPYGQMTTSRADFDQWYRTTPGINRAYLVYLMFSANAGVYTFESKKFFPLDPVGAGNTKKTRHDFGFTTELHATFSYRGGEHFSFTGDDDLWVFVNGKLAIDLGGLHPPATGTLDLDAQAARLGLVKGESYPLDLFNAERHTASSNFRVDTTLGFTDCGEVTPDGPE